MSKLSEALSEIKKKNPGVEIGTGDEMDFSLSFVPTGIPEFDEFLGGGWPKARFSVLGGAKGVGKSTLAMRGIAAAQKAKMVCVYVDLERTFSEEWAESQGVDPSKLIHLHGSTAEEVLDALMALYETKEIDFAVIDSVTALAPKGEFETKDGTPRSMEDDTIGLIARKLSQFFRLACGRNARCGCATLLISQVRTDIGSYGGVQKITGGNALQHYNSLTLTLRRGPKAHSPKIGEEEIGFNMILSIDKTKINDREGKKMDYPFLYGEGPSRKLYLLYKGLADGTVKRRGAWLEFKNGMKFQGIGDAVAKMKEEDFDATT